MSLIDKFDEFPAKDNHVYCYLRVSTDKQNIDSQIKEIYDYCIKERLYPPKDNIYCDEAVSGFKVKWENRKLKLIYDKLKKGDILIIPELSRLGRKMGEINALLHDLSSNKKIIVIDIKNNLKLDGSLQSQIMSSIFNIASELERNLISERTKKGMATDRVKEKLKTRKTKQNNKLNGKEEEIKEMIKNGIPKINISKKLGVHNAQLYKFIKNKNLANI